MHLVPIFVTLYLAMAIGLSLYVLTRNREPANTLAWILGFFLFPYVGPLLYAFFGFQRIRRARKAKPHPQSGSAEKSARLEHFNVPADLESEVRHLAELSEHLTTFPALSGNSADLTLDPELSIRQVADAIAQARHHVHLSFYIMSGDAAGRLIREQLMAAVRRGVKCRVLLDSVGCLFLPRAFLQSMQDAGIQVAVFSPFRFKRVWHLHMRNHRKLVIIDGEQGFTGSQNLLDNYSNVPTADRLWLEIFIRVKGPVVRQMQSIFAEDWRYTTREELSGDPYFPPAQAEGALQMQTVPTGPDLPEQSLHLIFLSMIHAAQDSVTIVTPYLVPSQPVALALEGAARRGVRVSLLLPLVPDNSLARLAGRSWYPVLLEAGVRIYELPRTPLHAKAILIDRHLTLLGSANIDARSFQLNFEAGILIYGPHPAVQLQELAESAMKSAHAVQLNEFRRLGAVARIIHGLARLFSPLL